MAGDADTWAFRQQHSSIDGPSGAAGQHGLSDELDSQGGVLLTLLEVRSGVFCSSLLPETTFTGVLCAILLALSADYSLAVRNAHGKVFWTCNKHKRLQHHARTQLRTRRVPAGDCGRRGRNMKTAFALAFLHATGAHD